MCLFFNRIRSPVYSEVFAVARVWSRGKLFLLGVCC